MIHAGVVSCVCSKYVEVTYTAHAASDSSVWNWSITNPNGEAYSLAS